MAVWFRDAVTVYPSKGRWPEMRGAFELMRDVVHEGRPYRVFVFAEDDGGSVRFTLTISADDAAEFSASFKFSFAFRGKVHERTTPMAASKQGRVRQYEFLDELADAGLFEALRETLRVDVAIRPHSYVMLEKLTGMSSADANALPPGELFGQLPPEILGSIVETAEAPIECGVGVPVVVVPRGRDAAGLKFTVNVDDRGQRVTVEIRFYNLVLAPSKECRSGMHILAMVVGNADAGAYEFQLQAAKRTIVLGAGRWQGRLVCKAKQGPPIVLTVRRWLPPAAPAALPLAPRTSLRKKGRGRRRRKQDDMAGFADLC